MKQNQEEKRLLGNSGSSGTAVREREMYFIFTSPLSLLAGPVWHPGDPRNGSSFLFWLQHMGTACLQVVLAWYLHDLLTE